MASNDEALSEKTKDLTINEEAPKKMSKSAMKRAAKGKDKKKEKKAFNISSKKAPKKAAAPPKEPFVNKTPVGEKKDFSVLEMENAYNPPSVESAWDAWWQKSNFFTCDASKMSDDSCEKFIMVIPPPNVTGSLHLGHGLTVSIQDTLTRWHRMSGHATLWVPGTDHAGIATQSVVEKRLAKKHNGLSRHDLGREEFLKRVWDWKDQYEKRIHTQFRKVGCSVDWTRSYFSMDDNVSSAVITTFNKLWEEGLVYRATRLINWSCQLKTALSDIEVDHIDLEGPTMLSVPGHSNGPYEFGTLTSFGYRLEDDPDTQVIVATTRLETMLGDVAVAVHPEDERYSHLHGKFVRHPFIEKRRIPIICDAELVDMNFGTGCVKITPAHDANDYLVGKRHNLEFITVIDDTGAINVNGGERFCGMMRYDARVSITNALQEIGQYHGKVANKMRLGKCSRSGDIIEPLIKPQWFIKCKEMAQDAIDVVNSKELRIVPHDPHVATWHRWLENIRDWCISRQLWWGHRIPAYYASLKTDGYIDPASDEASARWVAGLNKADALAKASKKLGVPETEITLTQDDDVLDTWFSAALFPLAVFGDEKDSFYPTTLLETGHDILFFWVARMVFMGRKLTGKLPFTTVYLHSMVRDKYGRKMSKSLGNVVDPLEIINGCTLDSLYAKLEAGNLPEAEVKKAKAGQAADFPNGIPEVGADALRFGLLAYTNQGRDINLDIQRLVGYRNFCNKIWNATKFAMSNLKGMKFVPKFENLNPRDEFILSRLGNTIVSMNEAFRLYDFGKATTSIYNFWLHDLCDVYLELTKPVFYSDSGSDSTEMTAMVLYTCLEVGLRLLHPIMPFVTEELWQRLVKSPTDGAFESITIAPYPSNFGESSYINEKTESNMALVKSVIHAGRSVRAEYNLVNSVKPVFYIKCSTSSSSDDIASVISAQASDIATLARASEVLVTTKEEEIPAGCALHRLSDDITLYVLLKGIVDFQVEIKKCEKKLDKLVPSIESLKKRMVSDFYEKVPEKVKILEKEKLETMNADVVGLNKAIEEFKSFLL